MERKSNVKPFLISSLAVLAVSLLSIPRADAVATITVNNLDGPGEGFNDPTPFTAVGGNPATTLGAARLLAFRHAAFLWGSRLQSDVEIQIDAQLDPLTCNAGSGVLGAAGPTTAHRDFAMAPLANTWYVQALANAIAGIDLDPATADATATFNSDVDDNPNCLTGVTWYYGVDGNPPFGQIDFVTVVLHELTHSLGFLSLVDLATGAKFFGFDDVYSNFLQQQGAVPPDYPSMTDAQRLIASQSDPNLVWNGPNVTADEMLAAGLNMGLVRMYGPSPAEPGSSVSHFSTALLPNELMEPFITGVDHEPGLSLSLLEDLGWAQQPLFGTDVVFLMDVTGSTGALQADWAAQIPTIAQAWKDFDPNARFALASHFDFPFAPYGNATEWAYRVETQFDPNIANLQAALTNLAANPLVGAPGSGADGPESQYEAIYQVLTGAGRELTNPVNYTDLGEIPQISLGQLYPEVIYHFTYPEVFHDRDVEPNYPFMGAKPVAGRTDVLNEIAAQSALNMFFGLTFITGLTSVEVPAAMLAEDGLSPLGELADLTGGSILNVGENLENLQQAIEVSIAQFATSPQNGDADGDGILPPEDNCPEVANQDQADFDGDGVGDPCDNCIATANPDQTDRDLNGRGDVCNCVPGGDADGDSICDAVDLCPGLTQSDITQLDTDEDGIPNECDNCTFASNAQQYDADLDGIGNTCDCDFNNDNFCGGPDFTLFIGCFNADTGGNPTCEAADMNGDGFVGGPDFTLFIGGFNGPPGPAAP
jgi:hypothetical protein